MSRNPKILRRRYVGIVNNCHWPYSVISLWSTSSWLLMNRNSRWAKWSSMSVGSWWSLQRISRAFSSWPLDTNQRGLSGTVKLSVRQSYGIVGGHSPKNDPTNKQIPQRPRTAFGKRQPKDEWDSKKHPKLESISWIQKLITYSYPIQPASANPMLMKDPCAPDIKPREWGGETSEKYVGIAAMVCPAASPVITRPTSHCGKSVIQQIS
jgi:hypothetical protein